jgi:hypothetical protein
MDGAALRRQLGLLVFLPARHYVCRRLLQAVGPSGFFWQRSLQGKRLALRRRGTTVSRRFLSSAPDFFSF